jgi:hypothetical protein
LPKEKDMSQDEFNRHLQDIVSEMSWRSLLAIPGVYEALRKELNNEVLGRMEEESKKPVKGETGLKNLKPMRDLNWGDSY